MNPILTLPPILGNWIQHSLELRATGVFCVSPKITDHYKSYLFQGGNGMNNELFQDLSDAHSQMIIGGVGMLLPACQAAREAARNSTSHDELSLAIAEQS